MNPFSFAENGRSRLDSTTLISSVTTSDALRPMKSDAMLFSSPRRSRRSISLNMASLGCFEASGSSFREFLKPTIALRLTELQQSFNRASTEL
jgi:hypothetical protein